MKATKLTKETVRYLGTKELTFPEFSVGDTIAVSQRIKEGDKERLQVFEGDVLKIRKYGISSTFTVRKIGPNSIAIERVFPYHSPMLDSIKVVRRGDVRRAKLYFMRDRVGRAARVKERIITRSQREQRAHDTEKTSN